jgi:N-acetylneuraminic acid mutarotase
MCLSGLMMMPDNVTATTPQQWQNGTALSTNCALAATVTGPDNQIYIFGGWTGVGTYSSHSIRYDTVTGSSTNLAAMPKAIDSPVAAYYQGNIYLAGGRTNGGISVDTLYQYNIQQDTWKVLSGMLKGVSQAMGAMDDSGRLWVVGGFNSADKASTNTVQIYDTATNTWSNGTSLPSAIYSGAGFKVNNTLYIAGGMGGGNNVLSSVYAIAMNGGTWTAKAAMPSVNANMGVTVGNDGQAYLIGGSPSAGLFSTAVNTTFIYNPESNVWRTGPALAEKVLSPSVTSTGDGSIWRIGGVTTASAVSKNVSSLKIMTITQTVAPSTTIGTGQDLAVTINIEMAYNTLESVQGTAQLVGGNGTSYGSQSFISSDSATAYFEMSVPQLAPAGEYSVTFTDVHVKDAQGNTFVTDLNNISISVVSMASTQDQISALQAALAQARMDNNQTVGGLEAQIASLQANNSELKTKVDSKADGNVVILMMVFAIVAVILVALMMFRKKGPKNKFVKF